VHEGEMGRDGGRKMDGDKERALCQRTFKLGWRLNKPNLAGSDRSEQVRTRSPNWGLS
jgi:hypothetical protein